MIHTHHSEFLDDMSIEILLIATIGLTAPFLSNASTPDMLAIPGAMLAAVVALFKAIQEKKEWAAKGIVVVGSSVVGSTAPSAMVHWFWPDSINRIVWQFWGLLGFLSGLIGWAFLWACIMVWDRRQESLIEKAIKQVERRKFGHDQDTERK